VVYLWRQRSGAGAADEAAKREAVDRLVAASPGIFDTVPDPDVGRVLLPNLERENSGVPLVTNALGWREGPVAIPKPLGVVRLIMLGDSFVFAPGTAAEERMGRFLAEHLAARAGAKPAGVEGLHLGMGSWNIQAEAAYLGRSVGSLAPDLVAQIVVANDLDDSGSVRGFGAVADFTPQRPEQTAVVFDFFPIWAHGFRQPSYLAAGLSHESRHRYRRAADWIAWLARRVEGGGGDYLLVMSWQDWPAAAASYLPSRLPARQTVYLSDRFRDERGHRISGSDPHWTRQGHEDLAKFLYGAVLERGLLRHLRLADWPEARAYFRAVDAAGRAEASPARARPPDRWRRVVAARLDFHDLDNATARQIYGGVYPGGLVGPYASVLLRRDGERLRLAGGALAARELDGAEVRVFADEFEVGVLTLRPGRPVEAVFELPAEVRRRDFFDVRLSSREWVYDEPDLRRCVVFRLDRVESLR
jgi:hypothetical protein